MLCIGVAPVHPWPHRQRACEKDNIAVHGCMQLQKQTDGSFGGEAEVDHNLLEAEPCSLSVKHVLQVLREAAGQGGAERRMMKQKTPWMNAQ